MKFIWAQYPFCLCNIISPLKPPHMSDLRPQLFLQVPMEWYTRADTRPRARWWPWRRSVWRVKRKACRARPSERLHCCRSSNIPTLSGELSKWRDVRFLNWRLVLLDSDQNQFRWKIAHILRLLTNFPHFGINTGLLLLQNRNISVDIISSYNIFFLNGNRIIFTVSI